MASVLFDELLIEFKSLYKLHKKIDYVADKGDNKAIGLIIGKIRQLKPELNTAQMKEAVIWFFKISFETAPKWIVDSINLKLLNSQFNPIRDNYNNNYTPSKAYAAKNQKENYYNGNKKVYHRTGTEKSLEDIINSFSK